MRKIQKLTATMVAVGMTITMTACGSVEVEKVDLNAMSLEEIIVAAQEEGEVNSVGMPDTWANWGGTWNDILDVYGIKHTDVDMSSAEEIALFEAEKGDATKDIGDVGQAFGPIAESKGVTNAYKTSYWDSIPDWAKDEDGDWIIAYYGTISIMTNTNKVTEVPTSFEDILAGDYMVSVGDVTTAAQAQATVLAAARAFGGDEGNLEPGIEFFRQLAEQGRIDKGEANLARLEKGEIDCMFMWDYNAMSYRDQIVENNPNASFEITIPSEASVQSGYATIINAYSKRPHAAALAREYILSDQGQINLAIGYATPIREDLELPVEVLEKRIDQEQYKNAEPILDNATWTESAAQLGITWQEEVMAYAK